MLTRETVMFRDNDGRAGVRPDVPASNYRCIWGAAPDTRLQRSVRACCVEGVEIYQGEGDTPGREDLKKIRGRVGQLTDEDCQLRRVALARGRGPVGQGAVQFATASISARIYRGACIFHIGVDHSGGAAVRYTSRRCAAARPDPLEAADPLAGPAALRYRRQDQDHDGAWVP